MEQLISRQAAIDALDEQIEQCNKSLSSFDISMKDEFAVKVERASLMAFRETLEYLPSAEPKRGKWVDDGDPLMLTCGNCGYGVMRYNNTPFCPNCGAKMEDSEDETD